MIVVSYTNFASGWVLTGSSLFLWHKGSIWDWNLAIIFCLDIPTWFSAKENWEAEDFLQILHKKDFGSSTTELEKIPGLLLACWLQAQGTCLTWSQPKLLLKLLRGMIVPLSQETKAHLERCYGMIKIRLSCPCPWFLKDAHFTTASSLNQNCAGKPPRLEAHSWQRNPAAKKASTASIQGIQINQSATPTCRPFSHESTTMEEPQRSAPFNVDLASAASSAVAYLCKKSRDPKKKGRFRMCKNHKKSGDVEYQFSLFY